MQTKTIEEFVGVVSAVYRDHSPETSEFCRTQTIHMRLGVASFLIGRGIAMGVVRRR